MVAKLNLTRDQLAAFLKDHESIKQFENLFAIVDTEVVPATGNTTEILAANADAKAQQALDTLEALRNLILSSSQAPAIQYNNSIATDYADFNQNAPIPAAHLGRTFWDGGNTLNVWQTLNVAGKINEDNFFYIKASSAITKGQLVMFTGTVGASGVLTGAPATGLGINDGHYLMGVAAEDIALNGFGLIQWSGTLRGFNTTGSPYGETWADGDVLYYNPAYAGGMTKTVPTAPNVKAVIAAVINAATSGSGSITIRISFGSVLGGTDSNVNIGALNDGDMLVYDYAASRWENYPIATVQSTLQLDYNTYTPTLTNTTNITSSSAGVCQYMKVGDVVTVSGRVDVTATATGNTTLGISLPIASNLTSNSELAGTAAYTSATVANNSFARISGDTTNDRATMSFNSTVTSSASWFFTFTYKVI